MNPEFEHETETIEGLAFVNPAEFPDLDNAETGISIKPELINFNTPGESARGVFNGIGEITTKDRKDGGYKRIPAIVLQTKDGVKMNAGANLVYQLRTLTPGTAIEITYKGEERTGSGNKVKIYDVRLLNVPRVRVSYLPMVKAPALPSGTSTQPRQMTYEEAWQIEIETQQGMKKIGELSKENLDWLTLHRKGVVQEAAQIVLAHDFQMEPISEEDGYPF